VILETARAADARRFRHYAKGCVAERRGRGVATPVIPQKHNPVIFTKTMEISGRLAYYYQS
jgi:hypothetical protein